MGSRRAPWRRLGGLGLLWHPGLAPLGALRAPLGAVLGALGPLLGPPGARLGLIWASRGAPFGAFWASVEGFRAILRKPRKSTTVQHFLRFFEVPGPPKLIQNRFEIAPRGVWALLEASWGLLGLLGALLGAIDGPKATQPNTSKNYARPSVGFELQLGTPKGTQNDPKTNKNRSKNRLEKRWCF